MDTLALKIIAGVTLWIISLCFGILIPYLIWRSTSIVYKRIKQEDRSFSGELSGGESMSLIADDDLVKSHCSGMRIVFRRLLSWFKVNFGKGKGLSLANCVCGGVFLGVCLLDLIPQSREDVDDILTKMGNNSTFPFSEFAISIGLLLIMAAENIAMQYFVPRNANKIQPTQDVVSGESDLSDNEIVVLTPLNSPQPQNIVVYRNYILAATLSLHSIFEGLAIGLQADFAVIMQLFIAISVHKAVLTFGIGLRLFETLGECGKVRAAVICSFIFCTASPIGCAIGTILWKQSELLGSDKELNPADIASALLQCLATGTFLYVTFIEVIPNEFSHQDHDHGSQEQTAPSHDHPTTSSRATEAVTPHVHEVSRMCKLLALIIGFGIASGLQCL